MIRPDHAQPRVACLAHRGEVVGGVNQKARRTHAEVARAAGLLHQADLSQEQATTLVRSLVAGMREDVVDDPPADSHLFEASGFHGAWLAPPASSPLCQNEAGWPSRIRPASVSCRTRSTLVSDEISRSTSPRGATSITASSVMIRCTTLAPVSGSPHRLRILGWPSRVVCSIATTTRRAPATRSIAPPM